jgi:hypothetical protein
MITQFGLGQAAILLGSQMQYMACGPGSATISSGLSTLTGSEFIRILITGSPDFSVPRSVTIRADLNSIQANGLVLSQFGEFNNGTLNTGSVYNINQLNGSIVCDGTIELSFEDSFTVS